MRTGRIGTISYPALRKCESFERVTTPMLVQKPSGCASARSRCSAQLGADLGCRPMVAGSTCRHARGKRTLWGAGEKVYQVHSAASSILSSLPDSLRGNCRYIWPDMPKHSMYIPLYVQGWLDKKKASAAVTRMLGVCMHAGIVINAGHRLPEAGNR